MLRTFRALRDGGIGHTIVSARQDRKGRERLKTVEEGGRLLHKPWEKPILAGHITQS